MKKKCNPANMLKCPNITTNKKLCQRIIFMLQDTLVNLSLCKNLYRIDPRLYLVLKLLQCTFRLNSQIFVKKFLRTQIFVDRTKPCIPKVRENIVNFRISNLSEINYFFGTEMHPCTCHAPPMHQPCTAQLAC